MSIYGINNGSFGFPGKAAFPSKLASNFGGFDKQGIGGGFVQQFASRFDGNFGHQGIGGGFGSFPGKAAFGSKLASNIGNFGHQANGHPGFKNVIGSFLHNIR